MSEVVSDNDRLLPAADGLPGLGGANIRRSLGSPDCVCLVGKVGMSSSSFAYGLS